MLQPGTILQNRYRVERAVGSGGYAHVYRAVHLQLDRTVAIKALHQLSSDPTERSCQLQAFEAEAKLLAGLDHVRLARVTDFFEEHGTPYLVMDFIEGHSLEEFTGQPQQYQTVVAWARQLIAALEYLHGRTPPVIIRDLKPANLMLTPDGNLKLIDFGIARQLSPGSATVTLIKGAGSAGFAPIEQYGRGTTDERSDLYALGATLYFLLTGAAPPEAARRAAYQDALVDFISLQVPVPRDFWAGVVKLLEVAPQARPQSVAEAELLLLPPGRGTITSPLASPTSGSPVPPPGLTAPVRLSPKKKGNPLVEITTNKGTFVLELFQYISPHTVAAYLKMVNRGFYQGIQFHREEDRVIQACLGPPFEVIAKETNDRKHLRGCVSMAGAGLTSEGPQFFICLSRQPIYDRTYTVFGRVVANGLTVIDALAEGDVMQQVWTL